ncbi:MAG: acetate--CoA ligase family protein [Actinobacteria bacterium]|nr:acetate--CoA ligase family protein [Actinomycetota bacterium]
MDPSRMLAPRSIAVVGASDRPGSYADLVLRNLAASGFEGPVWGVNPKRSDVHGRACFPSVAELPEPADAVVVAIPAPGVPAAVEEAGASGCGGAIVISAGFAEIAAGRELQRQLREAALRHGLPVCGPNGNGVIAVASRAPMWGDAVEPFEPGPVAMVSQSGNVAVNALGSRRGLRFHTVISTGNQAVMDSSDWLTALAEAEDVRSVAMFLEGDGEGGRLAKALAACADRGIGVAVLKVGSSEAGARSAAAHTAAVAGDQRVFRSLVEEAGGAWAEDPHDLLELAKALAEPRARVSPGAGLAVLTCSGGDSGIAADEAARTGVPLPQFSEQTAAKLEKLLPAEATIANPLDYTAVIWGDVERLRDITAVASADPAIEQVMVLYDQPQNLFGPGAESWEDVRRGIIAGAEATEASVLVSSTLPDLIDDAACEQLSMRGVVPLSGLRTAMTVARALRQPAPDAARIREIAAAASAGAEYAGQGEGAAGDGWLDEAEAKRLLAGAGVSVARGQVAADADAAVATWRELGGPVALKLAAPGLLHKSEAGALVLGLDDEIAIREAFDRLAAIEAPAGGRVLVEEMANPEAEMLVAAHRDGVVPALAIGFGGIWTEALDDVAVVPLPVDAARAERAIRSLRASPLLTGGRGRPELDLDAAADLASKVGALLLDAKLDLVELNPVIVNAEGCVAVDAVIRLRATAARAEAA